MATPQFYRLATAATRSSLAVRTRPVAAVRQTTTAALPATARRGYADQNSDLERRDSANAIALQQMAAVAAGASVELAAPGHKFGLPTLPIPANANLKHRYDPVVKQVTGLIMRHGKLGLAQRNMSFVLNFLRTSPPPQMNPTRPLIPGSPPPTQLPLDPILYLSTAIDSVAPLLRIKSLRGAAGGGAALALPVPLTLRQRRRHAIKWILDAVDKKKARGSGRTMFAQKLAEEIVAVVEGRSTAWDRRLLIHKTGTSARANINTKSKGKKSF